MHSADGELRARSDCISRKLKLHKNSLNIWKTIPMWGSPLSHLIYSRHCPPLNWPVVSSFRKWNCGHRILAFITLKQGTLKYRMKCRMKLQLTTDYMKSLAALVTSFQTLMSALKKRLCFKATALDRIRI